MRFHIPSPAAPRRRRPRLVRPAAPSAGTPVTANGMPPHHQRGFAARALSKVRSDADGSARSLQAGFIRALTTFAGLAASVLALAGPAATAASAHSGTHRITVDGSMEIVDYDWPDSDDTLDTQLPNETRLLGDLNPQATVALQACADEVRGELRITLTDSSIGRWVDVRIDLRLYEGTGCGTQDLDARRIYTDQIANGASKSFHYSLTAGGGKVVYDFVIVNRV